MGGNQTWILFSGSQVSLIINNDTDDELNFSKRHRRNSVDEFINTLESPSSTFGTHNTDQTHQPMGYTDNGSLGSLTDNVSLGSSDDERDPLFSAHITNKIDN